MDLFSGSKLLHHLSRLAQWQKTSLSQPILLEIDMTNICDHKCEKCVCKFAHNSDSLSLDDAKFILEQSKSLGIKAVMFTGGGEPLLNKHTITALEFANRELGLDVGLITHGCHIDEHIALKIVENCNWCRVSLDASNSTLYTLVHGVKEIYWNKAILGIKHLIKQKHARNSETTIGIGYLVDNQPSGEMKLAAQLGIDLGVDYVQFRPFRETTMDLRPTIYDIQKKFADFETKVLCSESRFASINAPRAYSLCRATNFSIVVGADCQVYACCDTKYKLDAWIGNLRVNSLEDIWNSDLRKAKNGTIYSFCPHPCRHNSNNELLAQMEGGIVHPNFI